MYDSVWQRQWTEVVRAQAEEVHMCTFVGCEPYLSNAKGPLQTAPQFTTAAIHLNNNYNNNNTNTRQTTDPERGAQRTARAKPLFRNTLLTK